MDLQLFARVLWRFRFLAVIGIGVAITGAFLLFVRVEINEQTGKPVFSYRSQETWAVTNTLLVTQRGFPWGRSVFPSTDDVELETTPAAEPSTPSQQFGDSTRFSTLALLYAQLAMSGAVRNLMLQEGPIDGEIEASPVMLADSTSLTLPLVKLTATADSPELALDLAHRATGAFNAFLSDQQIANAIPQSERALVTVVDRPNEAELAERRPLTLPLVILLGVVLATLGLIFTLENLWPRVRPTAMAELPQRHTA